MHQPPTFTVDGDAIREERMQAGLEISDLAERAGISRRYLSHLEYGTRSRMRPRTYTALRAALNSTDERLLAPRRTDTPKEDPDG
ncbi:helix-turn-helix transcriptional regulator [Streptomyces sp. PKU-EA00015]|uniref:helix-turn-helix domain-containing protein n=1 Tax=Streptomyces sp. PKU-EA00015 TaxID=2748326 RepID=UPI0015A0D4A6|nr:helix-turn-helix transcriptional regulator [Streptomyces sp. PKU-EA00015]NWF25302.1 helix-turn-helix transcriptional regulator [Streptomyces sp. PKU-EA00015]